MVGGLLPWVPKDDELVGGLVGWWRLRNSEGATTHENSTVMDTIGVSFSAVVSAIVNKGQQSP
jgi:hypothetical protein